jgi:hypothetical protein
MEQKERSSLDVDVFPEDKVNQLQSLAWETLLNPSDAYNILHRIDVIVDQNPAIWTVYLVAIKERLREAARSCIPAKVKLATDVVARLLEACYVRYQVDTKPMDTSLLVHLVSTVLNQLLFTIYGDEVTNQEALQNKMALGQEYVRFLSLLSNSARKSPGFFILENDQGIYKSPSLDTVLVLICCLNFVTRKMPIGLATSQAKEIQGLLAQCERVESELIVTLCNQNPLLTLNPLAYIASIFSTLFVDSPQNSSIPVVSAYKVSRLCKF